MKTYLLDYEFNGDCPDDKYIWLTNVLALKAVDSGNFGVGCILVDGRGTLSLLDTTKFSIRILEATCMLKWWS